MPDTLTPNYNLVKPEIGGSNNSWGNKSNDNWDAVDTALKAVSDTAALALTKGNAAVPTASYTAADVKAKLLTVDGAGSGIDADTVDGMQAAAFFLASQFTPAAILAHLLTVDGPGSGIDADKIDGMEAGAFALASHTHPTDATLTALGALSFGADQLPYSTGPDAFALTALTAFGRSVLALADATALRNTIGAISSAAGSLADPGYIHFQTSLGIFGVAWGTCSIAPNLSTPVNYAAAFPNASFAVMNAPYQATNAADNDPGVSACTASGFTAFSASNSPGNTSGFYIAVGY